MGVTLPTIMDHRGHGNSWADLRCNRVSVRFLDADPRVSNGL